MFCLLYLLKTAKIGSLVDIQDSEDPEGLRVFYYLVQDLKVCLHCSILSVFTHSPKTVSHFLTYLFALQNQTHMITRVLDVSCRVHHPTLEL